ncbi:Serine/threonine-protein kinase env7 [Coemansia biformis]|uniref:non-specific serine/threonine protein kinase n=1 Tax=Coemansia biformis TaxID=1286918 RepID=A0A9W7YG67_9FUNG|nr:Serine/threonine-protein kinase env7 [Coemansia biformis]
MDSCGSLAGSLLDLASAIYAAGTSLVCGSVAPETVQLGPRRYQVARQLGEGGFSQVLLVEEVDSGAQYALKKIICHQGTDALAMAQREIDAGMRFAHPNIVPLVDHGIVDGGPSLRGTQIAYMVFPVYRRGSMFDLVMDSEDGGRRLDEQFVIRVFRGVCAAVRYLHSYSDGGSRGRSEGGRRSDADASLKSVDLAGSEDDGRQGAQFLGPSKQHWQPTSPGRAGGYAELPQAEERDAAATLSPERARTGGYAHRDIKLGNVMLADDGKTPILMDFGSVRPARATARTRAEALQMQDDAAENCTMPYRAPELFDVQRDAEIDERTDVWSLGCLLFAMAFGYTPFEGPGMGPGTSIALAAINAKYTFPASSPHSDRIKQLVDFMLVPDPRQRPFVDQVIALTDQLYPH